MHELVVHAPGHVGQGELPLLGGQGGVEAHLEQQVAELLLQVGEAMGPVQSLDGLHRLVRLLQQVASEALVSLLAVPGTGLAQRRHQLGEAHQLPGDRRGRGRDPQRGQMVGLDDPVEVVPRHLEHDLVGQAQTLEHGDRPQPVVHCQLDLGQHPPGVALEHEQWAPLARRLLGEAPAVDDARPEGSRIAHVGPRQLEERSSGQHLHRHLWSGPEHVHAALGDRR